MTPSKVSKPPQTAKRPAARHRWIAFLRAINVGGHVVKMDVLRAEFEALGFRDVETFIASGNVIFAATSDDGTALEQRIERRLERSLGYAVPTFLRTPAELAALVRDEPFQDRGATAPLWIGFLKSEAPSAARDRLLALRTDYDAFELRGREVFWMCRHERMSDSEISGAKLERVLGMPSTFRNVTTVRKLSLKTAVDAS
jgi:uncharacterized protein (DUF1697 family)